jgi:predicted DNA repair protein MutK
MKRNMPPYWMECVLELLLPSRDRETVAGDLREEFVEEKVPALGRFRASLWYLRQVVSFAPRRTAEIAFRGPLLALFCLFTGLAGGWLGVMGLLLGHRGRGQPIAAAIVSQAVLTLAALHFDGNRVLRVLSMLGSLAMLWLGGSALRAALYGADFEGYVLLIALALIVQSVLTVFTLPRVTALRRFSA